MKQAPKKGSAYAQGSTATVATKDFLIDQFLRLLRPIVLLLLSAILLVSGSTSSLGPRGQVYCLFWGCGDILEGVEKALSFYQ